MHPTGSRWLRILGGAFAANLIGWAVTVLYAGILHRTMTEAPKVHEIVAITLYPNLLLVPMAMGVMAAYFWQRLELAYLGIFVVQLCSRSRCAWPAPICW